MGYNLYLEDATAQYTQPVLVQPAPAIVKAAGPTTNNNGGAQTSADSKGRRLVYDRHHHAAECEFKDTQPWVPHALKPANLDSTTSQTDQLHSRVNGRSLLDVDDALDWFRRNAPRAACAEAEARSWRPSYGLDLFTEGELLSRVSGKTAWGVLADAAYNMR